MKERRVTVRCACFERAQYCREGDATPRSGRLTTLTDRGLGLWVREPHPVGERLTVSFALPGEEETLTTAGVVRWASATPTQHMWYSLGLEWLPLEETTRFRLDTFMRNQEEACRQDGSAESERFSTTPGVPRIIRWGAVTLLGLGVLAAWRSTVSLQQENVQLGEAIHQRNLTMERLRESEGRMRQELEVRTQELTEALGRVERMEAASATLREERRHLIHQLIGMEQVRSRLLQEPVLPAAEPPSGATP